MNHDDHVNLIRPGVAEPGGVWADFGSGRGAFTLALREVLGPEAELWSVDRDASVLRVQIVQFDRQFPGSKVKTITTDFDKPLNLPLLDGIVAANSIHFVRDRVALLAGWRQYLKPGGCLILVEYDSDRGNQWVPYPVSRRALPALAKAAGFGDPRFLALRESAWNGGIYSALLTRD